MAGVDVRLNVIVDAGVAARGDLARIARAAAASGATLIQYRDKTADAAVFAATASAIRQALAGTPVPFVVNDRVDIARVVGVDGVHLGQEDMDPARARDMLGPDAILGRTIKRMADVGALPGEPVDYACIGGVFATSSKANPDPPIGLDGFERLRRQIRLALPALPVSAIAGITPVNATDVVRRGADGIAVVSAVVAASDPGTAARELRRIVDAALAAARPDPRGTIRP